MEPEDLNGSESWIPDKAGEENPPRAKFKTGCSGRVLCNANAVIWSWSVNGFTEPGSVLRLEMCAL